MIRRAALTVQFCWWAARLLGRVRFEGRAVIYREPGSQIEFGRDIVIKSDFYSNLFGLHQRAILLARDGGRIRIADSVGISGATIYATRSIEIGPRTIIGANCKLVDNDFHPLDPALRSAHHARQDIAAAPIVIGEDCFIGAHAIILKGTVLGPRCIVGAGAVVSGRFEAPDLVLAGNPARVIRPNSGASDA